VKLTAETQRHRESAEKNIFENFSAFSQRLGDSTVKSGLRSQRKQRNSVMKQAFYGVAGILAAGLLSSAVWAQPTPPPAPRARSMASISGSGSYLGIGVKDIDADRARALNLSAVRGAEITSVAEDSPASKAGLKEGDVVLEFNGQQVEGGEQLSRMIRETPVGRQVRIGVWRNGSMQTLTPTIEARKGMTFDGNSWVMPMPNVRIPDIVIPPMPPMDVPYNFTMSYNSPMLGIVGESLERQDQFADFLGVKSGVLVKSISQNSAAEKAGLKVGDVIVKVEDTQVSSTRDITNALRGMRGKKSVTVTVVRNKHEMQLMVTIETASYGPAGVRAGAWFGTRPFTLRINSRPLELYIGPRANQPWLLELTTGHSII
jgi:serine protease Do